MRTSTPPVSRTLGTIAALSRVLWPDTAGSAGGRHRPSLALLWGMVAGAGSGLAAPALADPLNPLDFPSLGKVTLARAAYSISTAGTVPKLVGPGTELSGTISATGVAVFRFDDLTVDAGVVLTASVGTADRPLALLSSGNLTFAGKLDASGASGGSGTRSGGGSGGGGTLGGTGGRDAVARKPGASADK